MITFYLILWGIALFGFAFWYAYKKDHGAVPYVLLFLFEIFILYISYDTDFRDTYQGPDGGMGRGLAYLYVLILQTILTIATLATLFIYQAIKNRQNPHEGIAVSFFQNIHYWIWHYSLKIKTKHTWKVTQIAASILMSFYFAFILHFFWMLLLPIYNVIMLLIFPVVLIVELVVYRNAKYCTRMIDNKLVKNENDCILKDKYDAMSKEQVSKHKNTFFIYLSIAIIFGLILSPYLLNQLFFLISCIIL